jgi:hypothetical protein
VASRVIESREVTGGPRIIAAAAVGAPFNVSPDGAGLEEILKQRKVID